MARTMPNAPSVSMAPHPFRDLTDLLEDVVMSRRRRAERRPGEFMADRSGNDRRRRSGLPLAWLVLLILVPLAGPAPSAAGPYREYEIRFIGEASPLGKSPSDADLINAVAWTMSNKLDLPFPVGTKAYIYERYGSAKLLEFLGRFALQAEPREHWRTVFPIPYRQFGDEFRSRLEGLR